MTTNSQRLTFGAWLAAGGISPNTLELLPPRIRAYMHDDWAQGWPPYSPDDPKDPRSNS